MLAGLHSACCGMQGRKQGPVGSANAMAQPDAAVLLAPPASESAMPHKRSNHRKHAANFVRVNQLVCWRSERGVVLQRAVQVCQSTHSQAQLTVQLHKKFHGC